MHPKGNPMNVVVVAGRLSRPALSRELPSGDRLVGLEVTVVNDGAPAESVPVVWHDAPARAASFDTDDEVIVVGRVRRRFFRAGGATQSRTEVVADTVLRPRQSRQVRTAVEAASERLDELVGA